MSFAIPLSVSKLTEVGVYRILLFTLMVRVYEPNNIYIVQFQTKRCFYDRINTAAGCKL